MEEIRVTEKTHFVKYDELRVEIAPQHLLHIEGQGDDNLDICHNAIDELAPLFIVKTELIFVHVQPSGILDLLDSFEELPVLTWVLVDESDNLVNVVMKSMDIGEKSSFRIRSAG